MHPLSKVTCRAWRNVEVAIATLVLCLLVAAPPAAAAGGDIVWAQPWNAVVPGAVNAPKVAVSSSGYVFVAATFNSDLRVWCYRPDGTVRWTHGYDGAAGGNEWLVGVCTDPWGNVIVAGSSDGRAGAADWVVRKYAAGGKLRWSRRFDGTKHLADEPADLAVDAGGNVVVTGKLQNTGASSTWHTIKLTASGAKAWDKTTHGAGSGVAVDGDRAVYVTGRDWPKDYYVAKTLKYGPSGRLLWTRTLHNGDLTEGEDVAVNGKHVAVAGDSGSHGVIIKYTRGGSLVTPVLVAPAYSDFGHVGIDAKSRVAAAGGSYWNEGCDPTLCRSWASQPFVVVPTGDWDGGCGDLAMTATGAVAMTGYVYRSGLGYDAATVFVGGDGTGWVREYSAEGAAEVYQRGMGLAITKDAVYVAMDAEHGWGGGISDLVLVKYRR